MNTITENATKYVTVLPYLKRDESPSQTKGFSFSSNVCSPEEPVVEPNPHEEV
jgi:hypothetical protein